MWTLSTLLLCLLVATSTLGSPARCGQQQHSKCRKEPPGFFERTCETYFDCKYQPNPDATESPSVYFKCDNSKCACELFGIMREEFGQMAVGWDRRAKRCSASLGGMCGRQDGIEVFCDRGYECVNSKCDKVASLEKEEGCKNKQGCEFGQADPPCPDPNGCEFGRAPPATTVDYGMIDENKPSREEDPKYNEVQPGDGGRRRPVDSPPPPATSCEVTNSCEAAEPVPEPEGEQRFYRFDKGDPPGYDSGNDDKESQKWAAPAHWAPLRSSSQPPSRSRSDRKALPSRSVQSSRLRSHTKGRYQSSSEEEEQVQPETRWRDREFRNSDQTTSKRNQRDQPPTWFRGGSSSNSRSKGDDDDRRRRHHSASEEHQVRDDRRRTFSYEPPSPRDKGQYSNGRDRDYESHGRSRSSSRSDDRTKSSRSAPEDFGEDPGITFTYRGGSSSSRSNSRRETQTSCGSKGGCGGGGGSSKGDRRPSSSGGGGCDKCGGSNGGGSSTKRPSCGSKGCKGGSSNNRPEREDREGGSNSSGGGCGNKGSCTTPKPHWSMPKPKENEGCGGGNNGGSCGGNGGSKGSSGRGSSCGNKGCGKKTTTTERPSGGSCGGGSCGGRRGSGGGGGGGGHNFRPKTTARPRLPCGPENGCQKPKEEETSCEDNPESAGCGDDKDTSSNNKSSEGGCGGGGNKGDCSGSREEKMAPSTEEDNEKPCKKTNSCEEEDQADNNSSKCDKCGSAYNFYRYMNNSNPTPPSSSPSSSKTSGNAN